LRSPSTTAHDRPTERAKKFVLESPVPTIDEEEAETLDAIDEGIRDAKAGRTIPAEEVRRRLPEWITTSSTHKER
jgi:predicted transcriptional regulator